MNEQLIWDYFKKKGFSDYGIAGLMGNLYAESGFNPKNLQNTGNMALKMTDDEYTAKVDSGDYAFERFCKDGHGYGLAQWTWHERKAALFNYAKKCGKSIGDLQMQLDFMYSELKGCYNAVFKVLQTAKTVREASDIVLFKYEQPYDQSEKEQVKRAAYGATLYNGLCMSVTMATVKVPVLQNGSTGKSVEALQAILNMRDFDCGSVDGDFGSNTEKAVREIQKVNGLEVDGCVGSATWTALLN